MENHGAPNACSIKFYDEMKRGGGEESSVDGPSKTEGAAEPSGPAAVETKILELSDISVEVGGVGESMYMCPYVCHSGSHKHTHLSHRHPQFHIVVRQPSRSSGGVCEWWCECECEGEGC